MDHFSWKCLAVAAVALAASGCGGGGPRLYKAGGIVTHKGAPVSNAQVTFAYDNGNFANGITDGDGKFQLTYQNRSGGAVPGKCRVSISKKAGMTGTTTPAAFNGPPKSEAEHKARLAAQQGQMQEFARRQAELDTAGGGENADFTRSGLVLEITTNESENNFVIDFKD